MDSENLGLNPTSIGVSIAQISSLETLEQVFGFLKKKVQWKVMGTYLGRSKSLNFKLVRQCPRIFKGCLFHSNSCLVFSVPRLFNKKLRLNENIDFFHRNIWIIHSAFRWKSWSINSGAIVPKRASTLEVKWKRNNRLDVDPGSA